MTSAGAIKSALETSNGDFLSLLMFERNYLREMMDIGAADAEARLDDIARLLKTPVTNVAA